MRRVEQKVIDRFVGYTNKAPAKIADGLHQVLQDFDVRSGNLVKCSGLGSATLDSATYASTGLTTLYEFVRFHTGQNTDAIRYIARDGNKIMLWNGTSWSQIDSALSNTLAQARFMERNGVLIIATGQGSANEPEWYGYIPSRWNYGYTGVGSTATNAVSGSYQMAEANVGKADSDLFSVTEFSNAGWLTYNLTTGTRYYKIAVQYGGTTWSLPSDFKTVVVSSDTSRVKITLSIDASDNPRITGFRIYASSDNATYYKIREVSVNNDLYYAPYLSTFVINYSFTYVDGTGVCTVASGWSLWVNDLWNDMPFAHTESVPTEHPTYGLPALHVVSRITDTDASAHTITIPSGLGLTGTDYGYILEGWLNTSGDVYVYNLFDTDDTLDTFAEMYTDLGYVLQEDISANYKYVTYGGARQYIAGVYKGGETFTDRVYFSHIGNNGISQYDVFRDANYIDVGAYGVQEIIGLDYNSQRLYIFGKTGILILYMNTGNILTWRLERLVQDVGVIAEDSIFRIPDGQYAGGYGYLSPDGPRILYNSLSYPVGEAILDPGNYPLDVTDLTEAYSFYDTHQRYWCISFPTDTKVYCYSLLSNGWIVKDNLTITHAGKDDTEDVVVVSGTNIRAFNGTTYGTSTYIDSQFKSGVLVFGDECKLYRIGVCYASTTALSMNIYLNRSTTAAFTITLPANTSINLPAYFLCPYGQWGREVEIEIKMSTSDKATNTNIEISSVIVEYSRRRSTND